MIAPKDDPDTPRKFMVTFFANSLLERLEGVVILKQYFAPDGELDFRSFYNPEFGIPNVSVDYSNMGLHPVDIEKTVWSREKIQKQAYVQDINVRFARVGGGAWEAFIKKYPFYKIPIDPDQLSSLYSPPEFKLSMSYGRQSNPQPSYFALLTKGEFSPENQVVFNEMELGKVLKSDNWFNLFFDLANFPVRDEAFDRSITKEGEFNKDFFAYSITPAFIEDYSLLIHRLGNPVEKLPPDVADIRSKLQTDMGRAVLDKLVEYFAAKDKPPATSNAPATSEENINLKDVEAQNMTVYSHYYANSLLNEVSGAVIVRYDKETLDNPLTTFIRSKIDGKSISPANYNLIRVSVEKKVWSDCAISNVIYVLTPDDPGTNNPLNTQIGKFVLSESKTIKIPFSKRNPADASSVMTMPHYNFGYDHEERPMKFFIILDSGRFNSDIADKFLTQYGLKTPKQILKKTGLDENPESR